MTLDFKAPDRPPTVASPVGSIQAPAAATVLIGRRTVLQCCALLPACCYTCIRPYIAVVCK